MADSCFKIPNIRESVNDLLKKTEWVAKHVLMIRFYCTKFLHFSCKSQNIKLRLLNNLNCFIKWTIILYNNCVIFIIIESKFVFISIIELFSHKYQKVYHLWSRKILEGWNSVFPNSVFRFQYIRPWVICKTIKLIFFRSLINSFVVKVSLPLEIIQFILIASE